MVSEWPIYAISIFGALSVWLGFRIGQYNLATVVYMAAGGYPAAVLASIDVQLPWFAVVVLSMAVAAVFGLATGLIALRVHGFTYALLTLALVEIMLATVVQIDSLGAARGLLDPDLADNSVLVGAGAVGALLVTFVLVFDFRQFGLRLRSFELGAERLASLGDSPRLFSLQINVLTAALAGLAGLITFKYTHYIQPSQFDLTMQIELLTFVIVGGVAGPLGPVAVALVLTYIGQQLDNIGDWRDIIMAAILLVAMLARAQGLIGNLRVHAKSRFRQLVSATGLPSASSPRQRPSTPHGDQDAEQ